MSGVKREIAGLSFFTQFLKAVLCAAVVFDVVQFVILLASVWHQVSWAIVGTDLVMPIIEYPFIFVVTAALTVLPAWGAAWVDAKWNGGNRAYYGLLGGLSGVIAFALYIRWSLDTFGAEDDNGFIVPFLDPFLREAWLAGLSGIIGGLVFHAGRSRIFYGYQVEPNGSTLS